MVYQRATLMAKRMELSNHQVSQKNGVSQSRKLRDSLEEDIVNGILKPGERLDEVTLSQRFGVSRTPIREAFRTLIGSGLAESIPNRGTFVTSIGIAQLIEMFDVMAELEGMCARLATRRITDKESEQLQQLLDNCTVAKETGDPNVYFYENELFHDCIYRASHNEFLIRQVRQLQTRLKPYRRLQLRVRNRLSKSLKEHKKITAAILAGNEAAAEAAAKIHVKVQGERFNDFAAAVGKGLKLR